MAQQVGVLLIDDAPSLRDLTRILIEEEEGLRVVGEAETIEEALELLEGLEPQVILLDHVLPQMDGLDAIPLLREKAPNAAVVLYTAHVFPGLNTVAAERGAQGLVEKGTMGVELAEAIRSAAEACGA